MKKVLIAGFTAGIAVLLVSLGLLYASIFLFPDLVEEYFSPVFRESSRQTDWLFYVHPFILSFSLKWFWERYKQLFKGIPFVRALELAFVYGIVAMVPVLWLTFSAIDVSLTVTFTWLIYGIIQAFVAGFIFAWLNP